MVSSSAIHRPAVKLTPVRAPDDCAVTNLCGSDSKIGQLHRPILVGEDVGTFNITVYHTLVMQVDEAIEDLGNIYRNQAFRELSEPLANIMKRTIFAVSRVDKQGEKEEANPILKDNIQVVFRLHEAFVLDDVEVL